MNVSKYVIAVHRWYKNFKWDVSDSKFVCVTVQQSLAKETVENLFMIDYRHFHINCFCGLFCSQLLPMGIVIGTKVFHPFACGWVGESQAFKTCVQQMFHIHLWHFILLVYNTLCYIRVHLITVAQVTENIRTFSRPPWKSNLCWNLDGPCFQDGIKHLK